MAPTWRFVVWRVMGHRSDFAPLGLLCARLRRWTSSRAWNQAVWDRNGPPGGSTALQRRDPDLARVEVDVAGPGRERLAHAAPGEREGLGEGLDRGLRVGPDRGEEALAFGRGEVLAAAGVDQAEGALGHDTGKLHYSWSNDQTRGPPCVLTPRPAGDRGRPAALVCPETRHNVYSVTFRRAQPRAAFGATERSRSPLLDIAGAGLL